MLHIKHLELSTDAHLPSSQAQSLAHELGRAIEEAWRGAGSQSQLRIDHLEVQADAADLQRPAFVGDLAASLVTSIERRQRET
jgi:hypothetical protein